MTRPTRADAGGRAYLDLQNLARRQARSTQALLVLYVLERFLARLAAGPDADRLVLKGGMLLAVWDARRATLDGDFLARSVTMDPDQVLARIVAIADAPSPTEDGVQFLTHTATAAAIRDDDRYGGVRIVMHARVAGADVKLQLDVSAGDPVTPPPQPVAYPTLRDVHPPVTILGYPLTVVIAEKLCTAVELGAGNSRIRDYADIWTLTDSQPLHAAELLAALTATAAHRSVTLRPLSAAIGSGFGTQRASAYAAYRRRLGPDADRIPGDFSVLVNDVIGFADPLLAGAVPAETRWDALTRTWQP